MSGLTFNALLRKSMNVSDYGFNVGTSYIRNLRGENNTWFVGAIFAALMFQVIYVITKSSVDAAGYGVWFAVAFFLSLLVYVYPFFEVAALWFLKPVQLFLTLHTIPQQHKLITVCEELYRMVNLSPIVNHYGSYSKSVTDDGHRLSIVFSVDRMMVTVFTEPQDSRVGSFEGLSNEEFLICLKKRWEDFNEIPVSHRFMLLCPDFSLDQISTGVRLGLSPEILAGFCQNDVPRERWDELKGFPLEWALSVI